MSKVSGIVTSQIHTLNSLVDFARQHVKENYHMCFLRRSKNYKSY